MNKIGWMEGTPAAPEEILNSRTRRVRRQREMCAKGCGSLISMTLNIPGPVKQFSLAEAAAEICLAELQQLFGSDILEQQLIHPNTGSEALIRLKLPTELVKKRTIELEESHPLGRLFDLDVLGEDGRAVSRTQLGRPPRPCLLCGRDAKVCARSRSHSMEDLQAYVVRLLNDFFQGERPGPDVAIDRGSGGPGCERDCAERLLRR